VLIKEGGGGGGGCVCRLSFVAAAFFFS
jgi:hypothetical protein